MDPELGRRAGGGRRVGGNKGNGDEDDVKENIVARSFVSFSSEKETKEPWHPTLLSLGDVMMDPDPK